MNEISAIYKQVRAFAPASVANVACAFDILGFALHKPGDYINVSPKSSAGVHIESIEGDNGRLPTDPKRNTASVVISNFLSDQKIQQGISIKIIKKMPLGSGMGSSAASAVAALVAVNKLFGDPLSRQELLPYAVEGERVACGAAHADNVAPSLLGGFTLIRGQAPLDVVKLNVSLKLHCALLHPHIEICTEEARKILKKEIPLKSAVIQWGNVAGLITGLLQSDYSLVKRSLLDVIIEPERSLLIPNFSKMQAAAIQCGALGCSISGSGPSLFALCQHEEDALRAGNAMQREFNKTGIGSDLYISGINEEGATIEEAI